MRLRLKLIGKLIFLTGRGREIMDEADVTLHYLLACVEAMDKNKKMPRNIDTDIAMHRNHAFNWLLGIQPEWDVI